MPLVDMDALIEEREGRKISDIFQTDGESYFRKLEREMSRELGGREGLVISTGGGIVLNPENIEALAANGLVVCLQASPDVLMERLKGDSSRPLLEGSKEEKIRELLEVRRPLYAAVPYQVDTDSLSPEEVAEQILSLYETNLEKRA
jgi:shikimate kinase